VINEKILDDLKQYAGYVETTDNNCYSSLKNVTNFRRYLMYNENNNKHCWHLYSKSTEFVGKIIVLRTKNLFIYAKIEEGKYNLQIK
jgi:hypothetical protein